ncbi:MBOAT family protein [Blautia sp. MSK.20.9]|nr:MULTISPECIES: MBOAT family O-acyltransferase [Blautia]NSK07416.1 MBOAT family protein [Blautia sp. MSK.20.9]UEA29979.1 MBOAT family protein [Blautia massiliensis (ex Durand et al. 2017)]UWO18381.1 MBOAT family protein [Blautia sp. KLE_1732_HM_1032]
MVFSSMVFLCVFLPAAFCLHLLLPGMRAKNFLLVVASLVFYAYGEPIYVILLVASSAGNYILARLTGECPKIRKLTMTLAVVINLGLLVIFKYSGFLVDTFNSVTGAGIPVPQVRMPIGISFFTFQALSYVIDVYRGDASVQKNFGKVLLYISFFPQLIAGPIVKYHDVEAEINNRKQTPEEIGKGIRRFIAGLSKKVLIANTMGLVADNLFGAAATGITGPGAWLGAVSYMLQIYFDFSGYSDMALGLGMMFGFHFHENFDYPYISASIREFWRRWHMSLSGWFKEYLYIPLGGNRRGKFRTVVNKMIVFVCTGIWHGASFNFLFWGIYHGFFLMLEEYIPFIGKKGGKLKSFFQHVYALLIVCVGFVFFRADTMKQGCFWIREMFTDFGWKASAMSLTLQQLTPVYLVTLAAALVAAVPVNSMLKKYKWYEGFTYVLSLAGFALCVLSLAGGTYNPFIYFRF